MGFKRLDYSSGEYVLEIKIFQAEGGRQKFLERWKIMISDLPLWFDMIREKYGSLFKKRTEDLEWLR